MTGHLPQGYTTRAAALSDAAALADLMNRHSMDLRGRVFTTADRQTVLLSMPGFTPSTDTHLVLDPLGDIIGYGLVLPLPAPGERRGSYVVVDPDHAGKDIEPVLLRWIEDRALSPGGAAEDSPRVAVEQQIDSRDTELLHRLKTVGYRSLRIFHRMEITLSQDQPVPSWPVGVQVRSLDPGQDLGSALASFEEIFADHWGHVSLPQKEGMERLRHRIETHPDLDPALWFLAMDGEDIAGICFAFPRDGDETSTGYVETLGVRRPWRGRGLALALLHHAFGALRGQGAENAFLYVDSESLTGATRLYEKAGMHVTEREFLYAKDLRPAGGDPSDDPRRRGS